MDTYQVTIIMLSIIAILLIIALFIPRKHDETFSYNNVRIDRRPPIDHDYMYNDNSSLLRYTEKLTKQTEGHKCETDDDCGSPLQRCVVLADGRGPMCVNLGTPNNCTEAGIC